jgi:hypothetical protein
VTRFARQKLIAVRDQLPREAEQQDPWEAGAGEESLEVHHVLRRMMGIHVGEVETWEVEEGEIHVDPVQEEGEVDHHEEIGHLEEAYRCCTFVGRRLVLGPANDKSKSDSLHDVDNVPERTSLAWP